MRNQLRTIAAIAGLLAALAGPAAAQTSGIQAGLIFGPAASSGESGLGFITGWYANGDRARKPSPADFQAELLVGARDFQSAAFFGRGALLLRLKAKADDDLISPSTTRVHFLIGPQLEWRRGTGSIVAKTGARPDVKLVLGGDIETRSAFLELRYSADVATRTRIIPPTIHPTPSGPRLIPSTPRKELDLRNGSLMVTLGMRMK